MVLDLIKTFFQVILLYSNKYNMSYKKLIKNKIKPLFINYKEIKTLNIKFKTQSFIAIFQKLKQIVFVNNFS